jgi:hypothetical protein
MEADSITPQLPADTAPLCVPQVVQMKWGMLSAF